MQNISEKIRKLLALAERAGTEAEAQNAMEKAHKLLAEHNLDIDDVKSEEKEPEEAIETDKSTPTNMRNAAWFDGIYGAVARLYFCQVYMQRRNGMKKIHIMGKPSNIAVVKYIAAYLTRTAEALAQEKGKEVAQEMANEGVVLNVGAWRQSFKVGFYSRIYSRVADEIKTACAGKIKSESTGRALVLAPLYDKEKQAMEVYKKSIDLKLGRPTTSLRSRSSSGYKSGQDAANGMNLRSNAVGGGSLKQIAGA